MLYKKFLPRRFDSTESLQIIGKGDAPCLQIEFSMLLWNIFKARRRAWEADFLRLSRDIDIVLLQEAVLGTKFDPFFTAKNGMEWIMAKSHFDSRTMKETGVKTGCVVSSVKNSFLASKYLEPFFQTPKMLLATEYPLSNGRQALSVINLHAINFVSLAKYLDQLEQIETSLAESRGPVILAGDFNTWSRQRQSALRRVTEKFGLQELSYPRRTRAQHLFQHLDHVFYRGLIAIEAKLVNVNSSDHDPIYAKFRLADD